MRYPSIPPVPLRDHTVCGIISHSGPNGEPLACGYVPDHAGDHSWSTLPTWTHGQQIDPLTGDDRYSRRELEAAHSKGYVEGQASIIRAGTYQYMTDEALATLPAEAEARGREQAEQELAAALTLTPDEPTASVPQHVYVVLDGKRWLVQFRAVD